MNITEVDIYELHNNAEHICKLTKLNIQLCGIGTKKPDVIIDDRIYM